MMRSLILPYTNTNTWLVLKMLHWSLFQSLAIFRFFILLHLILIGILVYLHRLLRIESGASICHLKRLPHHLSTDMFFVHFKWVDLMFYLSVHPTLDLGNIFMQLGNPILDGEVRSKSILF